ncbi:MAG: hypothetical protein ACTSXL_05405 [Alphaproteobacteria bacterium]
MTKKKESFLQFLSTWNKLSNFNLPSHHEKIASWLEKLYFSKDRRGLLMAFRNSGKSTLVGLFCAWVLFLNPNDRIVIVSADTRLATKMSRHVRRIIERHPLTPPFTH